MDIKVLKDRVLIEKVKVEKKESVIILTELFEKVFTGRVVKVGELVESIKENDKILFEEQHTIPINIEGKEYLIIRDYDIIAIV